MVCVCLKHRVHLEMIVYTVFAWSLAAIGIILVYSVIGRRVLVCVAYILAAVTLFNVRPEFVMQFQGFIALLEHLH